ncbi:Uu.00g017960.m01.CDS01 [Anthostomella pinea]|uniref:RNA helicase n=1 Tax=Anthostomella pinea TaxID=933095 RepID=A0AAI8VZ09_9PEZI|nr:Uu.00g017960.m01.CDS01 [Anthostomella pinea]
MRSFLRSRLASPSCAVRPCRRHAFTTTTQVARKPSEFTFRRTPSGNPRASIGKLKDGLDSTQEATAANQREVNRTYAIFRKLALTRCDSMMTTSRSFASRKDEYKAFGVDTQLDFQREAKLFKVSIERSCDLASLKGVISRTDNPLFWQLRSAFVERDIKGLNEEIVYAFQNFLMRSRFPKNIAATHKKIADFRFPYEWFPATRALQRTVYLHVGPTNSGKTYNALKALEEAKSGIYAGPLRLLAHEVYSRFLAKGKKCALITGEEQRVPKDEDNYFRSCTVEMTPLNHMVDVAVIDEIQMIGDSERGWAWTQAFLGVQAKEVHLCGEERAVELIQSLCATIGDKCVLRRYERLSGLQTMSESLSGSFHNLQKGDAVVSFSRVGIHSLKKQIENATGRRVAIVYGSLPPEIRAQQAALFNDPDNDYDILVASDAIGMGLNLEIRRVIFEQTHKRDGNNYRQMTISEVKQIGGRAGRFRTANHAIKSGAQKDSDVGAAALPAKPGQPGLVTAMEDDDLAVVIESFNREAEPLKTAGIQPPPYVIERFSSYFPPNTPFSYILLRLREIGRLSSRYHICSVKEMLSIADLIQPFPMSVYDRCVFLNAPVALREPRFAEVVQAMARCVSSMEGGDLVDIKEIDLELLDVDKENYKPGAAEYLSRLETLHKAITLYLWLSYRYSGVFSSQALAFHVKALVEEKIDAQLSEVNLTNASRRARNEAIKKSARARKAKMANIVGDNDIADGPPHEGPGEWRQEGHEEPLFDDQAELEQITRLERKSGKNGAERSP